MKYEDKITINLKDKDRKDCPVIALTKEEKEENLAVFGGKRKLII